MKCENPAVVGHLQDKRYLPSHKAREVTGTISLCLWPDVAKNWTGTTSTQSRYFTTELWRRLNSVFFTRTIHVLVIYKLEHTLYNKGITLRFKDLGLRKMALCRGPPLHVTVVWRRLVYCCICCCTEFTFAYLRIFELFKCEHARGDGKIREFCFIFNREI